MEEDASLRRVERASVAVCVGMAACAWVLAGAWVAAGVLGGGVLSGVSYATLRSAVTALADAVAPRPQTESATTPPRVSAWTLVKAASRYALLALLAYVMIARLRLHPVGLLAGASSVVAAIAIEAVRFVKKP